MKRVTYSEEDISNKLIDINSPVIFVENGDKLGVYQGDFEQLPSEFNAKALLPIVSPEQLGNPDFRSTYRTRYAYMTGAMANAIASADLVIAMGRANLLASYGAGGVLPQDLERDIVKIKSALNDQPFAVNLIHSPHEPLMEQYCIDILLKHHVKLIEASAFLELTLPLIEYRLAGVYSDHKGVVKSHNKVIAKLSRTELAEKFMQPAPASLIDTLVKQKKISSSQAILAKKLPVADDITVEADSGGHTDRRSLVTLFPLIVAVKKRLESNFPSVQGIRIGAAGGIGTPQSALAAFSMGADYIVTGSINQACVESGTSDQVRELLTKATINDVDMAPAADMFEMGVQLQVLKRGTLFSMRAKRLYELYKAYPDIGAIPKKIRDELEQTFFKCSLDREWKKTEAYFSKRDATQIQRAIGDPKKKMALLFRSYLGQSSSWANQGNAERVLDYQVWSGPAMGAFNAWVEGSYLEHFGSRRVADIAEQIMSACAFEQRKHLLRLQGLNKNMSNYMYPLNKCK